MIKIVDYLDKYKDSVVDLILDVYENELGFVGYDRPDIYKITEVYQNNERSNFWVMLNESEVIGTVAVLEKTKKMAFLKRMVLKKKFRKQGLGKDLLQIAVAFAQKKGFKILCAGTIDRNPYAIEFYKHHGFVQTEDVPEGVTADNNSICLRLKL